MTQTSHFLLFTLILFAIAGFYVFYPRLTLHEQVANDDYLEGIRYNSVDTTLDQNITLNATVRVQNDAKAKVRLIFTYRDLEAQLCKSAVDWPNKTLFQSVTGPCPKKGIISVISGGRTGNQLWEYASVWAVARRTGLDPYVPKCIRLKLDQIFEQLSIPSFEKIADCLIELNTFVTSLEEWSTELNQNIILPRFSSLWKLVSPQVKDIIKEYRFTKELRENAQKILRGFIKTRPLKKYTFVAVHVRRTDYIKYLKDVYKVEPVTQQFFTNAMNYYRYKYPNCLFVYVSDDTKWCSDHFGTVEDAVITSNNTAALDLAIMGACNHSIFDYGTYGEWGSILAGGEAVTQNFRSTRLMKNGLRISQNPPS